MLYVEDRHSSLPFGRPIFYNTKTPLVTSYHHKNESGGRGIGEAFDHTHVIGFSSSGSGGISSKCMPQDGQYSLYSLTFALHLLQNHWPNTPSNSFWVFGVDIVISVSLYRPIRSQSQQIQILPFPCCIFFPLHSLHRHIAWKFRSRKKRTINMLQTMGR